MYNNMAFSKISQDDYEYCQDIVKIHCDNFDDEAIYPIHGDNHGIRQYPGRRDTH